MDMSNRSIRDGILLISGYHFFMALIGLIGVFAIIVYGVVPQVGQEENLLGKLFIPVLLALLGLAIVGLELSVGFGLPKYKNSSRLTAVFLSTVGIFSGFIAVLGVMVTKITSSIIPDWFAIIIIGLIAVCVYAIMAFMDIFVLLFLFNHHVRLAFYNIPDGNDKLGPKDTSEVG